MKHGLTYAFIGGAIIGGAAAILFAPEPGSEMRARVKRILKKKGIDFSDDDVEDLVDQISMEIED